MSNNDNTEVIPLPESEYPETIKNFQKIVATYGVALMNEPLAYVGDEFEVYMRELPFCSIHRDETLDQTIFYIPFDRTQGYVDLESDEMFYTLGVITAILGEEIGPLIATSHYSLNVREDLLARHEAPLARLEVIRNYWALNLLYESNRDLWIKHMNMLPGCIKRIGAISHKHVQRTDLYNISEGLMLGVLMASLSKVAEFEHEEDEILLQEMEDLLQTEVRNERMFNEIIEFYSLLSQTPSLKFIESRDIKTFQNAANSLLEFWKAKFRFKIMREVGIATTVNEDAEVPSKYLIHLIPAPKKRKA